MLAVRTRKPTTKKLHASDLLISKRYRDYRILYRYNFLAFILAHSPRDKWPTFQQAPIINAMSEPNFRLSVVSGHSTGKTWLISWYIIWQIVIFDKSTILLTAPKLEQLQDAVFPAATHLLPAFVRLCP